MELMQLLPDDGSHTVYHDELYSRKTRTVQYNEQGKISILYDALHDYPIQIISFSIECSSIQYVTFSFPRSISIAAPEGFLVNPLKDDSLYWFASAPARRIYNNKIIEQESRTLYSVHCNTVTFDLGADIRAKHEFSVMYFRKNSESFIRELCSRTEPEKRRVRYGFFFDLKGFDHFWNSYVHGDIYTNKYSGDNKREQPSEQNANILYKHYNFLYSRTSKNIYAALSHVLAYSVLLRMDESGRWRHGSWSLSQETHTRFQSEGVDMLLSFYQTMKKKIFFDKAKQALDFLISIADHLDHDNMWFLHDTLETSEDLLGDYYPRVVKSTYLGKSLSNTLCLNTHIQLLYILKKHENLISEYRQYYEKGLSPLLTMMHMKKGRTVYAFLYAIRDFLWRRYNQRKNQRFQKLFLKYSGLLRNLMFFLKQYLPLLFMPNGYIERDLCASNLSDGYHFVNLIDLVSLYSLEPREDLIKQVIKSTNYSVHLVDAFITKKDPRVNFYIDALWFLSCKIDEGYLPTFIKYVKKCYNENISLSPNIFSCSLFTDVSFHINLTNPKLIFLSAPKGSAFLGIIMNPTQEVFSFKVSGIPDHLCPDIQFVDASNNPLSLGQEIIMKSNDFIKIINKVNN